MPTRKPSEVRRAEIADAALSLIATRGIAALSTQALADAVGVSTGALFKHYPSRDAVLLAVAARVNALLQATFPSEPLPPDQRLAHLADARLALLAEQPGVLTLMLSEQFTLALPAEAVVVLRDAVARTVRFVAEAIHEGQQLGSFRADVPADALAALWLGALQMTAFSRRAGVARTGPNALAALKILLQPT